MYDSLEGSVTFKNVSLIKIFLIIGLMNSLLSCVGTVNDKNNSESSIAGTKDRSASISFEGLVKVSAISDTKIEVFFREANDAPTDIIYELYVNNSSIPLNISPKTASRSGGLLKYTVTGLRNNSLYLFNMQAVYSGKASSNKLDPNKALWATTFINETANFIGITSAVNLSGTKGKTQIQLKWMPATITDNYNAGTDPYQYEISYIPEVDLNVSASTGGISNINNINDPLRKTITIYATNANYLSTGGIIIGNGTYLEAALVPGKKYYFQVRSIHKNYSTLSLTDQAYKRELNTNYAYATTLIDSDSFNFTLTSAQALSQSSLLSLSGPVGVSGLTSLYVSWIPATGLFNNYLVCYKINSTTSDVLGALATSSFINTNNIITVQGSADIGCKKVVADLNYLLISGLTFNSKYQVKVIACKTDACETNNRIISSTIDIKQITAAVAQFNGVVDLLNPTSFSTASELNRVKLTFAPPIKNTGHITKMEVRCHNGSTDTTGYVLSVTPLVLTGGNLCDGLSLSSTTIPVDNSAESSFYASTVNNVVVQITTDIDGNTQRCFSITPQIVSGGTTIQGNKLIRCSMPRINKLNLVQFPGKTLGCSLDGSNNLQVNWNLATGGLLSGYRVFWFEKPQTESFNFSVARAESGTAISTFPGVIQNPTAGHKYYYYDIQNTISTYSIPSSKLEAGKTYSIGVIPILNRTSSIDYGDDNFGIDDCKIPLPNAKFVEWVDLFAVGPKQDGLTPLGSPRFLYEKLDVDGIPIEESSAVLSDPLQNDAYRNAHDGTYGLFSNSKMKISNSGIIKLSWKDITLLGGSATFTNLQINESNSNPSKHDRKYGYKILRSIDGQKTWVDLTSDADTTSGQTAANSGYIYSDAISGIASFTDYSVATSGTDPNYPDADRARIYYYKIVPIYNGNELIYTDSTNPTHHIVRVTLPPKNMALVHRLIANSTLCNELSKSIDKTIGRNYSCSYNGLGSKGTQIGNTIIDQGGDLLVDRYELSCSFTRGPVSNISTLPEHENFADNKFSGCLAPSSAGLYEPGNVSGSGSASDYKKILNGDCFGSDPYESYLDLGSSCDNRSYGVSYYIYPGSTIQTISNCSDLKNSDDLADVIPTQSEFGAVYYSRSMHSTQIASHLPILGAGGNIAIANGPSPSSCMINLPYNNTSGHWRPRWLSLNSLFGRLKLDSQILENNNISKNTISDILANNKLYDSSTVKVPSLGDNPLPLAARGINVDKTPLVRIMTSNASKLPPLTGLTQDQYQQVCSSYKIEVGYGIGTNLFSKIESKTKRLLRRSEFVVSTAWPSLYPDAKKLQLENGKDYSPYSSPPERVKKSCNTVDKVDSNQNQQGLNSVTAGESFSALFPQRNRGGTSISTAPFLTGSSLIDIDTDILPQFSTEKCVSRFGVQDLIGNMQELLSDRVFCNADDFKMTFQGPLLDSVTYFDRDAIDQISSMVDVTGSVNCSITAPLSQTPSTYPNNTEGDTINEITTFLERAIDTIVTRPKTHDQKSVLTARNGDGNFLTFGPDEIMPSLAIADSIKNGTTYFNTLLGLPLACVAESCDDSSDNKIKIKNLFLTNTNSDFASQGLRDLTSGGGYNSYNSKPGESFKVYDSNLNSRYVSNADDPSVDFYSVGWQAPRYKLNGIQYVDYIMLSGGGFDFQSGRYSLDLKSQTSAEAAGDNLDADGRCSVLINQ